MIQTPSTSDNPGSQEDEQYYQKHLLSESFVPQQKYSISANDILSLHSQNPLRLEGWLLKKSPKLLVGWQKRYVKINNGKLLYYKGIDQFKGCLDFRLVEVKASATYRNGSIVEIQLELVGVGKTFQFRTMECKELALEHWFSAIQKNITAMSECPKRPMGKCEIWRHERISHDAFLKEADTGDLLLFKGKTTMNKIQRAITGDDYDHVALLLRYNNGELFIFEAIGSTGVSLLNWNNFVKNKWHLLYQQLVFRHLDIERSDELIEKLENFIKVSLGKRYQMSPGKILKRFSHSAEDVSDYDKEDKTFFCSELVAAAFKKMGILSLDRCAASYWPGIFSQNKKHKLDLQRGSLQQELLIDFSN